MVEAPNGGQVTFANASSKTTTATFSLALRPDEDVRIADASRLGATTNMLIRRYGLPIPEVFPPGNGPIPTAQPAARPTPVPSPAPS